jgi:hypothetical protein
VTPAANFHGLVSVVTVYLMYVATTHFGPAVKQALADSLVAGGAAAALAAFATYRLLSSGLLWLLRKSVWLRARILGSRFVHGTWVGFFVGHSGERRYVVEHFEQDLERLSISGRSYTQEAEAHAQWSTEAATVDADRGRLIYSYTCDVLTRTTTEQGVGVFQFEREAVDAAPTAIAGYVADLADGERKPVHQVKISNRLMPWSEAIREARRKYKDA